MCIFLKGKFSRNQANWRNRKNIKCAKIIFSAFFRLKMILKENIFFRFIEDVVSNVNTLSLPRENYKEVIETRVKHSLDFDDSYQFNLAKVNNLSLVTLDKDFRKIKDKNIVFL